ncbi:heavy-metal-associated domain-containing protein [Noviherbaspirillum massiliense]|uniref:heavy-metal-associated domain-containing protein n=1 Tax=Noviherbaspirillum massiliense TaxID=1465823 RepID=UPI0002E30079|nr:cation transporter [Noviherbaspirillum massiliense]
MYVMQVEGMTCNHCVSRVQRAVQDIDATAKVEVDLATNSVRVESAADLDDIKSAVIEAGYPVTGSTAS